ncbi:MULTISPECIES: ATP-binding cassette domain-containing protein [Vibrio]|uniref:ATP-binding cassette domain-containing protein n=1 Tax=Vibrio TaxID=662 RepID=UPI0029643DA6|nr:ATP-binding cassette domain-containing protein [Vibrio sp. Vb1980]MDW1975053.1 ATP-binding cassette domain-containing protein [Vibrio sp. Vb1980]
MSGHIELVGVKTNNLKNIDFKLNKGEITSLIGISGGGKSSLAYNTLYELCKNEFRSLESGYYESPSFILDSYKNIVPSVALKQKNSNVNPRSSLYTYLNIPSLLTSLISDKNFNHNHSLLKINKPENQCSMCSGRKLSSYIDLELVIDEDKTMCENPFKPWVTSGNNKKHNLLIAYCEANGISTTTPFKELSNVHKEKLLYNISERNFPINFVHQGKKRSRKLTYIGVLNELNQLLKSSKKSEYDLAIKFSKQKECEECLGSGIRLDKYIDFKVYGVDFVDFLTKDIGQILNVIKSKEKTNTPLITLIEQLCLSDLSYLSFNRTIPSLSGGELQKVNFSKLCSSEITGILIVIDELSSQVHVSDHKMLFDRIKNIQKNGNTILLVEHNDYFMSRSDNVITIGPSAGHLGGYIVENKSKKECYLELSEIDKKLNFFEMSGITINNIKDLTLKLPINSMSTIVGKSGSGKSSLAKFINENFNNVSYISQDLIKGNVRSSVASLTGLNKRISSIFSQKYNLENSYFNINESSPIVCKQCAGKGVIKINRSFDSDIEITCPECDGKLFSSEAEDFEINGHSIREIYEMTLSELLLLGIHSIDRICSDAIRLGLGHLSLNRKTKSLSGGELKRIKLLINLPQRNTKNKIIIIDEPASGLDNNTAADVIRFIKSYSNGYHSIVLIEHKEVAFLESDYVIEIGPGSGVNGGKIVFEGTPNDYYNERYVNYIHNN